MYENGKALLAADQRPSENVCCVCLNNWKTGGLMNLKLGKDSGTVVESKCNL